MGAWGAGSFENDDAADWAGDLVDDGSADMVREVLATAARCPADDYLEAPDGANAIAAAEVVAAASRRPAESNAYSEKALAWAEAHPEVAGNKALALDALDRVVGANSELSELWFEGGSESEEGKQWSAAVSNLRARLSD